MPDQSLKNKVAIVTGGNAGIGLGTVKLFLAHGAKVASIDINEPESPTDDLNLFHIRCDVTSNDQVKAAVASVMERWGRIDILVNNAGVMDNFAATADINDDSWRKCFAVNVDGPMFFMRACIPIFLKQESKGTIVNVGSAASFRGAAGGSGYTATKHALLGLSRSTAWMYANEGIRCTMLYPGGTKGTKIVEAIGSDFDKFGFERAQAYIQCSPVFLEVEDLMPSMLYLVTAPGVNGAELAVNHGFTAA